MRLAFLAGFGCGVLALLFWIARSIGTAETPKAEFTTTKPLSTAGWQMEFSNAEGTYHGTFFPDPYTSDLADILRREAW